MPISKKKELAEVKGYGTAKPLNKSATIDFLYAVENPTYKNVNQKSGYVWNYSDGTPTIGPGYAKTAGENQEWFNGKLARKDKVDTAAYNHLTNDDEIIRKAYDKEYGTKRMPHPSDTLSAGARMYVAQARYQRGSLGDYTNSILKGLKSGNTKQLKNAVHNAAPSWDKDRIRRLNQAMPHIYTGKNNPKVVPSNYKNKK